MNELLIGLLSFLGGGIVLFVYKTFFNKRPEISVELERQAAKAEALAPIIEKLEKENTRDRSDFNARLNSYRNRYNIKPSNGDSTDGRDKPTPGM